MRTRPPPKTPGLTLCYDKGMWLEMSVLCVGRCVCEGEGEKKWEGKCRPVRLECPKSRRDVDAGK